MKRVEIMANQSIEEDLHDMFKQNGIVEHFTTISGVTGVGNKGPRMGNHIWPEENFILIVYCEEDVVAKIRSVIKTLKQKFTDEGIKMFVL